MKPILPVPTDSGVLPMAAMQIGISIALRKHICCGPKLKYYLNPGDVTIKDDLNAVRQRAKCTELYQGAVTIGDIMNERARELYWEEWRNVELKRVSVVLGP